MAKSYLIGLTILCVAESAPPIEPPQAALMEKIEEKIRLPAEAGTIDRFARAYKFASPDRVVAFYFVPEDRKDKWFCREAKKDGQKNGQIAMLCPPPDGMKVGERRWFSDDAFLPSVSDGGCNYVDVEYDLKTETVVFSRCHGAA